MEVRKVYEFLKRPKKLNNEIKRLEMIRAEIYSCLYPGAIRYDKDRVITTPQNVLEEKYAEVDEMDRKIDALRMERIEAITIISSVIECLPENKDRERRVLAEFYIGNKPMKRIARDMIYSDKHIYRLRKEAVRDLAKLIRTDVFWEE